MGKNIYFFGNPVFGQLINLIPEHLIKDLVSNNNSDYYYKRFKTYDHLVVMLYACLHQCESLRVLVTGIQAHQQKLRHLGLKDIPKRSTISDANRLRDSIFFEQLFHKLVNHFMGNLSDSLFTAKDKIHHRLFIVDSTTVKLFSDIMKGAGSKPSDGRCKGGAKVHVLLDSKHDLPRAVHISEGKDSDKLMFKVMRLPPHSIITFDKGYRDYKMWHELSSNNITWVTRPIGDETFEIIEERFVTQQCSEAGIIEDKIIRIGSGINKNVILTARYVYYKDPETGKELTFVTNNTQLKPAQIAWIYKQRWQIEVFFKRLKRHSPLRYFLGENENAIRIQIWCSLIIDLLIQWLKEHAQQKWSFVNVSAIVRHLAMDYFNLSKYLNNPRNHIRNENTSKEHQLHLFDTT